MFRSDRTTLTGRRARQWGLAVMLAVCTAGLTGCSQRMSNQPHLEPLEASTFFPDGMSARPLVPHTVARGQLHDDQAFWTGQLDGQPVAEFPLRQVSERLKFTGEEADRRKQVLERGRARYEIYCSVCHDSVGTGHGMVVQRGFSPPPSFHETPRLQTARIGHFYDVITNGLGRMHGFVGQIPPADRWAIAAYVRVLQFSQQAPLQDLPEEDQQQIQASTEEAP